MKNSNDKTHPDVTVKRKQTDLIKTDETTISPHNTSVVGENKSGNHKSNHPTNIKMLVGMDGLVMCSVLFFT